MRRRTSHICLYFAFLTRKSCKLAEIVISSVPTKATPFLFAGFSLVSSLYSIAYKIQITIILSIYSFTNIVL